ncbi:MAG TPA: M14 family metallopeptidase, partial [Pyrinomonadaceae bacterium]|nr:M14 family metallopeptidase [Pyrinomonadaceae bacterium]
LNPGLVTLITLPHTSWEGRTSRAVRVRAGTRTNRAGVLFTGSIHAREWGGSDICISFLTNIVNAYRTNTALTFGAKSYPASQVRAILENIDLFVFPDVNPDGKNFSQTADTGSGQSQSFWWRKNRNPNGGAPSASRGVDLNRNFDFLWSSGIGTSATQSSFTYKGTAPFSEPEARNVRHLFDTYPNIRFYVDIHSFGDLILYNWGDDNNQNTVTAQNFRNAAFNGLRGTPGDTAYREFISTLDENTLTNFGRRMKNALAAVRGRNYTLQQSVGLYPTSATTDDYAFGRHFVDSLKNKVYGYTIEFGTQFVPPFAEMQNIIRDVGAALTEFCLAANSEVFIRDSATDSGNVPSPGAFWNSPDIWVRNNDDNQTAHQNTVRGRDNFVYVRVRNRGVAAALDLKVRVYITTFAGTEFVHPEDWIPRNPSGGGSLGVPGTYLVGEATIASVAPGSSQIAKVRWPRTLIPPAANWHPCLLAEVSPNDGPPASGRHVWDNNNLAQKNITIVNAARGEFVEFPFRVGSPHMLAQAGALVIKKVRAPRPAAVYLDLKDNALLDALRPQLSNAAVINTPVINTPVSPAINTPLLGLPSLAGAINATLLHATTVAFSAHRPGRENGADDLIMRLPADTRIEMPNASAKVETNGGGNGHGDDNGHGNGHAHGADGTRAVVAVSGLALATVNNQTLLNVTAQAEGKLPLSFRPREVKPMSVRVAVPRDAAVGETYEYEVAQYDDKQRVVGGVTLSVTVTA